MMLRSRLLTVRRLASANRAYAEALKNKNERTRRPGVALLEQTEAWARTATPCKAALRDTYLKEEAACNAANVKKLADEARVKRYAVALVEACRTPDARRRASPVQALLQEYRLSSHEGVTLLSLAEALLRVRS